MAQTALAVCSRKGGRIRLEQYAVENLAAGDGSEKYWRIQTREALARLREKLAVHGPVAVILPAHLVLMKFLKIPRVEPAQRDKLIHFQAGQCLPVPLPEVVWDSMVAREDESGLEVLLAAAKLEAVDALCSAVQSAGVDPQWVLPSPLATLAAFKYGRPAPAHPLLILDLGIRSATFLLVQGEGFVARTLMLGDLIAPSQSVAGQPAETEGAFAARLGQEYTRSILHFRRQGDWPEPAMIYLTGDSAYGAGLKEMLADRLQRPVEYLEMAGAMEMASGVEAGSTATLNAIFGAAAVQLASDKPGINLLPVPWRRRQGLHQRQPWLITAMAMAVAALLPPLAHFHSLAAEARQKSSAIEQVIAPWREREARNRVSLARIERVKSETALLQGVVDRQAGWLLLLADLQDRFGRVGEAWLQELTIVHPAGFPLKLRLVGCMLSPSTPSVRPGPATSDRVRALLAEIADLPGVAAVEVERIDSRQSGTLGFALMLKIDPARPL